MAWKHLPVPTVWDSDSKREVVRREERGARSYPGSVICRMTLVESLHLPEPQFPSRVVMRIKELGLSYVHEMVNSPRLIFLPSPSTARAAMLFGWGGGDGHS